MQPRVWHRFYDEGVPPGLDFEAHAPYLLLTSRTVLVVVLAWPILGYGLTQRSEVTMADVLVAGLVLAAFGGVAAVSGRTADVVLSAAGRVAATLDSLDLNDVT